MKKLLVSVLTVVMSATMMADPIDLTKAKSIAAAYMDEGVSPELVESAVTKKKTASGNAPLYIFNRGNNKGFVIVSGDDSMPKIIGYTEQGEFDPDKLAPALLEMLSGYSDLVIEAQANGSGPRPQKRAVTGRQDIPTLVAARWGQGWPYNMYAPYRTDNGAQALTGCVATAAAQVVHYWAKENPNFTQQNTPTYGYGGAPVTVSIPAGTPLRWELMQPRHNSSLPEDYNDAVATLMYVIGTSTWLTYADGTGTATSGQISALVNTFSGQFNLSSTCTYKSGHSQEAWENLIYSDLEKGWPIVYSGVHPSNGGHAIVLDGYRAADNLFHFNFGWDGGSDGYYTVDDNNGVNGFSGQQGMTHAIHPRNFLLNAEIKNDLLVTRMKNAIEIEITNNGTIDYKGIYLYGNRKEGGITDLNKATDSDLTTVIPSGESMTITLKYTPPTAGTSYIYVMDSNARVIAQAAIPTDAQVPALKLEHFEASGSIETAQEEVMIDGVNTSITYNKVYGDFTNPTATIANSAEATATTPNIQCDIYAYDATQGTFVLKDDISERETLIGSGEQVNFAFALDNYEKNVLYAAQLHREYRAGSDILTMECGVDTIVYFKLYEGDLTVTPTEDNGCIVKGHWNHDKFQELTADMNVLYYDMTEVTGLNIEPISNNPNTLFYVGENTEYKGYNFIKNNVCADLRLTAGYDFQPLDDFTAESVTFDPQMADMLWKYIVLPFDCTIPTGSRARLLKKFSGSTIVGSEATITQAEACVPFLYRTTQPGSDLLTATNVTISTKALTENTDTLCGTFCSKSIEENQRKLNKETPQSFVYSRGATLNAFEGYLNYAQDISTKIYSYSSKDDASEELAAALNTASTLLEQHSEQLKAADVETLTNLIADAANCYTQQPEQTEIEDYTAQLNALIIDSKCNMVVTDEPLDMTELLENPSFETKRTTGWTVTKTTGQLSKVLENTSTENFMIGADGSYTYYSYSNTGKGSATINQELSGLKNGYYRVSAMLATDEKQSVTMFANDKTATMTDDGLGKRYLKATVIDSVYVSDGTLNIGVNGFEGWYKADNFRLYYLGGDATGIHQMESVKDELKVWSANGCIHISTATGNNTPVNIFTIDGRLIERVIVNGHKQVSGLPKGIYIVNKKKVIVK